VEAPSPATQRADIEAGDRAPAKTAAEALPIARLRQALDALFVPNPLRYWLDFAGSMLCFYGGFALVAATPLPAAVRLLAFVVSTLGLYRALIFIHELAHFPPGRMRGFRIAWNICCGIPLLAPDFLYETHADHHRTTSYGTANDGEYLPWGRPGGRPAILMFAVSSLLALPSGVVRFGVLGPLSWTSGRLRRWVAIHASSLVVDMRYCRPAPTPAQDRRWRRLEAIVLLYLCAVGAALLAGIIQPWWLLLLYLTLSAAMFLNSLRTLAAHRYGSAGTPLTATGQMLDSLNYPRRAWLNELWAPVGLRFHALHHLFPGIPYHNLAAAHARLSRLLPPQSPYHLTEGRSLAASLRELWRGARSAPAAASVAAGGRSAGLAE